MVGQILYPIQRDADISDFEPLAVAAARYLRSEILDGRLQPGAKIRQETVAKALGISRIPVREALFRLAIEGLVSLTPNSGARVAVLDFEELSEIYRIRERLEPLAIFESVPRLSIEQLVEMKQLIQAIDDTTDIGRWLVLDRELHLLSYSAAPMPRLLQMIEGFWNSTQQYRKAFYGASVDSVSPSILPSTHFEHWLLLDACERRDATHAEWLIGAHIRRTRILLADHQELFAEPEIRVSRNRKKSSYDVLSSSGENGI